MPTKKSGREGLAALGAATVDHSAACERVRMRRRKPCFMWRRRLFGWNVLFIIMLPVFSATLRHGSSRESSSTKLLSPLPRRRVVQFSSHFHGHSPHKTIHIIVAIPPNSPQKLSTNYNNVIHISIISTRKPVDNSAEKRVQIYSCTYFGTAVEKGLSVADSATTNRSVRASSHGVWSDALTLLHQNPSLSVRDKSWLENVYPEGVYGYDHHAVRAQHAASACRTNSTSR